MPKKSESKLRELQEIEFALVDLNLYLDTHPEDDEAVKKLAEFSEKAEALREDYEKNETILFSQHIRNEVDQSKWINDPWPWEKQ
ncbi:MAG TPA: spore coat protein CotJB [Clostridiaceae bacterium]|nr:spore coat protein CotJB [Clostridiaceae bacterium]